MGILGNEGQNEGPSEMSRTTGFPEVRLIIKHTSCHPYFARDT